MSGELARQLGCSEMTIRRDIRRLERDGFVRQTYGGATAHITRSFDISFNARALLAAREKRLIGMRVGGARRGCARRLRRDRQHRRAVRAVPSRAPRPHDRHSQPADREPAGDSARAGGDGRRVRPPGRADLRRPDRHRHPVPVSIRRRGDRRGGHLGAVGHHRADRGRSRGAARGTRTDRARDRHRRRLEGRRRDADRRRTGAAGSRP